MPQALDKLCGPGKPLKAETPDVNEIAGLLRTGVARLNDARNARGIGVRLRQDTGQGDAAFARGSRLILLYF